MKKVNGVEQYVAININIIDKNGFVKSIRDKNIILKTNVSSHIKMNQSEYKIYADASYQLKFYIINNTYYLEVFLLE